MSLVLAAAMTVIAVTSSATVTTAGPVDSGWRQFQYGPSHTGFNSSETTLGPDTVGQLRRLWKTTIPEAYALTTPSVANDRLVMGSYTGGIYSANATTGAPGWSYPTGSFIEGSAAIVRGHVYQLSNDGNVYALDAWDGHLRWSVPTGGAVSSVTVTHGVVYSMGYFRVYAIDAATGTVLWNPSAPFGHLTPSVAGDRLYVRGANGNVVAYDSATGAQLWKRQGLSGSQSQYGSIAASKDRLYLADGSDGLVALYARGGATAWSVGEAGCSDTTPSVAQGVVYIVGCAETLHAYDAATGAPLWSTKGPAASGLVSIANGIVWTGRSDGKVLGFDAMTGDCLVSRTLDEGSTTSVVVTGGVLYVSAGASLYAYGLPA